ncbi:unnamed protein product [Penicillium camemberti]|uniref:Str. FM013 n=1 Tax=Penicillium camemberti (strain FM 013) TaxID=1429867 RepID=A0A0G4NZN9_PENC3|nr:unnamed protein product [Penicillium camemberti]
MFTANATESKGLTSAITAEVGPKTRNHNITAPGRTENFWKRHFRNGDGHGDEP